MVPGAEGELGRGGVELEQVEFRPDLQPSAEFRHGDPERRWNARVRAGIEQVERTGEALAVGQRIEGLVVFGGGHGGRPIMPI